MFKIGQKVVCISTKNISPYATIKEGECYTILGFADAADCKSLILDTENNGEPYGYPYFYGYNPKRFKPLEYKIISNKEILKNVVVEKSDLPIYEPVLN